MQSDLEVLIQEETHRIAKDRVPSRVASPANSLFEYVLPSHSRSADFLKLFDSGDESGVPIEVMPQDRMDVDRIDSPRVLQPEAALP